jgi:hypothetical protein
VVGNPIYFLPRLSISCTAEHCLMERKCSSHDFITLQKVMNRMRAQNHRRRPPLLCCASALNPQTGSTFQTTKTKAWGSFRSTTTTTTRIELALLQSLCLPPARIVQLWGNVVNIDGCCLNPIFHRFVSAKEAGILPFQRTGSGA